MPIHFYSLLLRSFEAIPSSLGSTWVGLFFPLWGFLVAQIFLLLSGGMVAMKSHWKQNLIKGLAVAAVAWASLYLWCVATTIYTDHVGLAAKALALNQQVRQSAQHERDAVQGAQTPLINQLSSLRESCAKTDGANWALERQTTAQQNSINNCQTQALKLLTPEPFKIVPILLKPAEGGIEVQHVQWLLITNKTITPVNLVVVCNKRPTSISANVIGGGAQLGGGNQKLSDYEYLLNIGSPAWSPDTPMTLDVSYSGDENSGDENIRCSFQER
jgi:hypothetical protein